MSRIALVDDDRNILTSVAMTLEAEGFEVETYNDGQQAFDAFSKRLPDMAVLDIAWAMRKRRAAKRPPEERYSRIADRLCEAGRFGRKTGAGWYRYQDGLPEPDPCTMDVIAEERERIGISGNAFTHDRIMKRILAVIQAEATAILEEGSAESADDIDVVMVNGYGFPRYKGGPLFWSRHSGGLR